MKTNKQNQNTETKHISGLKNRADQLSTEKKDNRLPIDLKARKANRCLNTDAVLNMLTGALPEVYRLAEVVGKWVWVQFSETPAAEIREKLAQLGFHWNSKRQAWQHPCGQFSAGSTYDPHEKYSSYYPGQQAA